MHHFSPLVLTSSPSDAVSLPPALLEFQPVESVVMIGFLGRTVQFCGRIDLGDALSNTGDVLAAMSHCNADGLELIGYSADPHAAAAVLSELATGPFDGSVLRQHVTDGATAWRCDGGQLLDAEPFTPNPQLPQPERTRSDVVAEINEPRHGADSATISAWLDSVGFDQQQATLLACIISDPALHPDSAARAAAVIDTPQGLRTVTDAIADDPDKARSHLLTMRRHCADEHLPGVLALLAVACWASSHGAEAADAVEQLAAAAPGAPMLHLISGLLCSSPAEWLDNHR